MQIDRKDWSDIFQNCEGSQATIIVISLLKANHYESIFLTYLYKIIKIFHRNMNLYEMSTKNKISSLGTTFEFTNLETFEYQSFLKTYNKG